MEINVIRHHKIDESVAIVIAKRRACRPTAVGDARLRGDVGKRSVAVIVIEDVAAETGQVEIRPAVIVVVADGAAHREAWRRQARALRHVSESPVVIVVIERAEAWLPLHRHLDRGRIRKIYIRPAVAIVIE
jgi:hypothetical protein